MFRYLLIALLLGAISACGGGGGGGTSGGGTPGGGSSSETNGMSFSPSTVSFDAEYGTSKTFNVTATPSNPGEFSGVSPLVIQVVDTKGVLTPGLVPQVSLNGSSAVATLSTSSTLPIGNYQGSFQIVACANSACTSQLPGSPWTLPYNINVKYILAASTEFSSLQLNYNLGKSLPMNLTIQGTGLNWSVTTDVPWLQSTVSSGSGSATLQVNVNPGSLTVGSYTGNVIITSTDGQSVSKSVTLGITPQTQLNTYPAGPASAVANAGTNPSGVGFQIVAQSGLTWSVSSTTSWLIPDPASGSVPGYAGLDFQSASLAPGSYSGSATLRTSDGETATLPVSLTVYGATIPLLQNYAGQPKGPNQVIDGSLAAAAFNPSISITADRSGNLYVGDFTDLSLEENHIRKITPGGMVSTFVTGSMNQGEPALKALAALATDGAGNLYIADGESSEIIKVAPDGTTTLLAYGVQKMGAPNGLAIDAQGNIYFSDSSSAALKKLAPDGTVTTLAGLGYILAQGKNYSRPAGITLDQSGNVIVADAGNCTIKKVSPGGVVTVLAGQPGVCSYGDGNAATATFNGPSSIVGNSAGDYYIADPGNCLIRKLSAQGVVSTVAGAITAATCKLTPGPLPGTVPNTTSLVLVGTSLYFTMSTGIGVLTNVP